jgi:hypothetical protein
MIAVVLITLGIIPMVLARVVIFRPEVTTDSLLYMQIAANVSDQNCYSHLESQGKCIPTWGSNQPAGYPLFIALIRSFMGSLPSTMEIADQVILWQSILFSLAAAIALVASYSWHRSIPILVISYLVLAFSPLTVGWARWVLTETLAAAGSLLVFAAIFHSLAKRKLAPILIGLAVAFAFAFRWDQIWLLIPAILVALFLGGWKKGIVQSIWMGLLSILPLLGMVIRAAFAGISLLPTLAGISLLPTKMENDPYLARGVWQFFKASALTQEATSSLLWPLWDREYQWLKDDFVQNSIIPAARTNEFFSLLDQVSHLPNGLPLPAPINSAFLELADALEKNNLVSKITLVMQRSFYMWSKKDGIFFSGWDFTPINRWIEPYSRVYRLVLIFGSLLAFFLTKRDKRVLAIGLFLFVVLRTLFCASLPITMIEIRYLVPAYPCMEITLVIFLVGMIKQKSSPDTIDPG